MRDAPNRPDGEKVGSGRHEPRGLSGRLGGLNEEGHRGPLLVRVRVAYFLAVSRR